MVDDGHDEKKIRKLTAEVAGVSRRCAEELAGRYGKSTRGAHGLTMDKM